MAVILPLNRITMFLLGFSGICYAYDYFRKYRSVVGAIFGTALFLFGLDLVKTGTSGFLQFPWFQACLEQLRGQNLASFVIGMLATFLCQSHVGITLLAITMTQSGIFDQYQIIMLLYGTHAGSSLTSYFLSRQFDGISRQIVMSQVLFNVLGSVFFVLLFYIELWFGIPLVKALIEWLSADLGKQAAYLTVIFTIPIALTLTVFCDSFLRLLERNWPPSAAETLGKLRYINSHILEQPEMAGFLIEKEIMRVAEGLKSHIEEICPDQKTTDRVDLKTRHFSHQAVLEKTRAFIADALRGNVSSDTSERLMSLQNRAGLLGAVESELYNLCVAFQQRNLSCPAELVAMRILEATETAILTLVAVMGSKNGYELELLFQVSSEKGSYMEEIRKNYVAIEEKVSVNERLFILDLSTILERIMAPIARLASAFVGLFPNLKPKAGE